MRYLKIISKKAYEYNVLILLFEVVIRHALLDSTYFQISYNDYNNIMYLNNIHHVQHRKSVFMRDLIFML